MAASEELVVRLTVDGHAFFLWDRGEGAKDEKSYRLQVDRNQPVHLSLSRWFSPGLGYHEGRLAIWSGVELYSYDCATGSLSSFDIDDEVHTVYGVGDRWCVVCELSVVLIDALLGHEVAVYHHGEVLMESWWASGRLCVEDFYGRSLQFDFSRAGSELVPVEG